jgi:hypothetical protein
MIQSENGQIFTEYDMYHAAVVAILGLLSELAIANDRKNAAAAASALIELMQVDVIRPTINTTSDKVQ